ncbi:RNA-guided endonuclease TnpB family protein [Geitlerinema sp. PCC 7407]|uniref:RNA-guided endonuclease InsQ/TnpB family protein n=1 Tax=Geitlerinema sp. PCC 7407 TaxID=1173025 RepID=UPI00029FD3F2|nr:RNA-guided endonuclease TnpB family protein [Geitlerinema sp. PCC 7407]AFY67499.1 transposase IS891/IS1136/IS1341 family [Geitlerinema sp. PCC 7407]
MLTRRITYRLYPTRQQESTLHYWRKLHCGLYNAALANRKTQYQKFNHAVDYFEQQNSLPAFKEVWPEYKELGSHALQATLKRVDLAFQRFFKKLGGYPRFKASRRYAGWTYPCKSGWKAETSGLHGSLNLSNLGSLKMRGQARTWGKPTTCTIFWRHGKWYASITVQCEPARSTGEGSVGIDLGCKEAITLSTGEQISKPEFIRQGDIQVKQASKKLRRKRAPNRTKRIKASRRWTRERQKVSKLQRKVARQRENWIHQVTSHIVSRNSLVAGEKLNVKNMTRKGKSKTRQKAGLNRSILSVGFGMIGQFLDYKLAEAGGFYVESPTQQLKPSQRCVKCWELTPKTLSDRVHVCANPHCNHVEDRDVNAAQVNLAWARGKELASSVAESSSSTACGSMRQLGAKKRQKPQAS